MSGRSPDWRVPALTRRNFAFLSATALGGLAVTACGGAAPTPATGTSAPAAPQPTTASQATTAAAAQPTVAAPRPTVAAQPTAATALKSYQEAPQLAQLAKDGKLPPAAERLPKAPVVVRPIERVGKYGGTWRSTTTGPAQTFKFTRNIGYENLVRWDVEWEQVIPNVAESFAAGPDAKEYTFKLREGHKWSDGKPYTADDILFWYEDISLNKELTPSRGSNPPAVAKIDPYTVKFTFERSDGLFLFNLASGSGSSATQYPKHYLQQFHAKYNPQGVEQLARENGAESWVRLFQNKGSGVPGTSYDARWQNKDLPTLHPWMMTAPLGAEQRVVAERNPFYFKVDPEGNQLPYLDRVTFDIIADDAVVLLRALNGEFDMEGQSGFENKAVLVDNQQKGGYRFFETVPSGMNECVVALNLTHKEPAKRQIFGSKDFRVGLSHAINRQEIIDVVYVGQGEPWQCGPRKESAFYSERLAKQYTEYDVRRANEHLDRVLPQKDGQGFRLGPDGKRFSFQVMVEPRRQDRVDTVNLVKGYWEKVGVEMAVNTVDRALMYSRKEANEHDGVIWAGPGGLKDLLTEMRWYFPFSLESNFAIPWAIWFNPPGNPRAQPEEPPEAPKRQMELYRQLTATADEAKQGELVRQILTIAQEQFYAIGIVKPANGYGIVKNTLRNVPASMPDTGGVYPNPAPTNPSQYFFR